MYLKDKANHDLLRPTPSPSLKMAKPLWKSLTVLPLVAGCYQYVPTDHAALTPATAVSVELSSSGSTNVANKIGKNVVAVEGNVTEASPTSLTIALLTVRRRGETAPSTWSGESITLASNDIDVVKTRQLSRRRTAVASAAVAAASVGIVIGIAKATGDASGTIGGKPSPNP
jgi:hypothetical protein